VFFNFFETPTKSILIANLYNTLNSEITFNYATLQAFFFYQILFFWKQFVGFEKYPTFVALGEMAEWSNAAVLKTVVP
jgi:hypothetical protein